MGKDICARFVACAYATAPEQAAGADTAYGANGACFKTESASLCDQACASGLQGLHAENPSNPACALCASDADCQAPTPACNPTGGECVACTTNAHCGGATPACDTSSHTCVTCATDADCAATPKTPACDVATHACVACTSGAMCPSNVCKPDHTCCVAKKSCTGYDNCGAVPNGCGGTIPCGGCAVGSCQSNHCTSLGMPCTPGPASCAPGERCMFNAQSESYVCHDPHTAPVDVSQSPLGSACDGPLADTYCYENDGEFYVCADQDPSDQWHCVQLCLTSAECISGKPCVPYFDLTIISPQKPGYCF